LLFSIKPKYFIFAQLDYGSSFVILMAIGLKIKKIKIVSTRLGLSLQIFKTALAASVSWGIATGLFKTHYPFFAALAAILTVQVTVSDSLQKATQRITGIVLGVIISMFLGQWLELSAVSVFVVIFLGMTIFNAFKMNAQVINQVAVSSFLVMAFGKGNNYAIERIIETILGSGIAVIINALIVPQNAVPEIEQKIIGWGRLSSSTLKSLIPLFKESDVNELTGKEVVKTLITETESVVQSLKTAQQSLKYTPFLSSTRRRLTELEKYVVQLEYMTVQIRGIRRGLADLHEVEDFEIYKANLSVLDEAIEATANCISTFGYLAVKQTSLEKLENNKQYAKGLQEESLHKIKTIINPIVLRDTASILTDLNRILDEASIE
jgi:uncharacterized membrane protein YgaE (UPF0421/DUF939 family)